MAEKPNLAEVDRIIREAPEEWRRHPTIRAFKAFLIAAYGSGKKQEEIARDLGMTDGTGLSRRMKLVGLRIRHKRVIEEVG
jgi:hypothetical protein